MVCTSCMTFNHAPYIVDAMNGFTMQETTFPVYYLITDDASTDGEPDVIKQYLADYFQTPYRTEETDDYHLICAVHKTNPNCNFIVFLLKYNHYSIKKSKLPYQSEWRDNAKYIALCEGDDYWIDKKKLQGQIEFLENHIDYGLVGTVCKSFVQNENRFYSAAQTEETELSFEDLMFDKGFATCTTLFKKEFQDNYRKEIKEEWAMGDYPLWLYIASQSRVYRLKDCSSVYRVLPNSASHSDNIEKLLRFRISGINCSHFFIDRIGLSPEKKRLFCIKTAYQLYRTGLSLQSQAFIRASIEYKRRNGIKVTLKEVITEKLLGYRFTKILIHKFVKIVRYIKKEILRNYVR